MGRDARDPDLPRQCGLDRELALHDRPAPVLPAPEDAVAMRRLTDQLAAALADLEPIQREVILLRDIQELSAPEAAAQLGISIDALKSRLHRARVTLRENVLSASAPSR